MGTDAVVVGSGPNGLAAAVTLARAGLRVDVCEAAASPGGGCRTEASTLPNFRHDICATVHPLAAVSPFFRSFDLAAHGVALRTPRVALAHPLDDGHAATLVGAVAETAAQWQHESTPDAKLYRALMTPFAEHADAIEAAFLDTRRSFPADPLPVARFAVTGALPASIVARRFRDPAARALLAGAAAHSMLSLRAPASAGVGMFLMLLAHHVGWPVVEGGSSRLTDALVTEIRRLGGTVTTDRRIDDIREVGDVPIVLLDVGPRALIRLAGDRLPGGFRRALERFRYGPGVSKVDWALDGPVPWRAAPCREAVTVHVGGTLAEIARSENDAIAGRHSEHPFCIVVQPGVVDPTRAPPDGTTLWAYCHVPAGSPVDMADRIEAQIERFAPGFKDRILARRSMTAADYERYDANYVGGDINGGAATLRQTLFRPTARWNPYRTGIDGVYLCSSSTPPGGGVHGLCGALAARTALADLRLSPTTGS